MFSRGASGCSEHLRRGGAFGCRSRVFRAGLFALSNRGVFAPWFGVFSSASGWCSTRGVFRSRSIALLNTPVFNLRGVQKSGPAASEVFRFSGAAGRRGVQVGVQFVVR